jgi:hypothetical protein
MRRSHSVTYAQCLDSVAASSFRSCGSIIIIIISSI